MTNLIHRTLRAAPALAVSASGVHIVDSAGKRYLDACGGAAVSCLGHAHPRVQDAIRRQLERVAYAHTGFFTTEVAEELAERLIADAPAGIEHVYLGSGGSEAVEAALKLARQHFVERGELQRSLFVARRQSYHGNTLGALAVGGNELRRRQFEPLLIDVGRVSPCYAYRDQHPDESVDTYTRRLLLELDAKLQELGPQRVIAFVAETFVGATAGALPPTPGYFKGVREICDRYGILLIADEIMCGMGRTGSLHAIAAEGVTPDLMTIAKGLGAGYEPIGAVLASARVVDSVRQGSGVFQHGHTYIGHSLAAAAALEVQRVIHDDNLLEQVRRRGEYLQRVLTQTFGAHPHVGDIRGKGLFFGIELVEERESKQPFAPAHQLHACVKARAMANGLLVYPSGGTIDGKQGDHVLLAPPFTITEAQLDMVADGLLRSIDEAIAETRQ